MSTMPQYTSRAERFAFINRACGTGSPFLMSAAGISLMPIWILVDTEGQPHV